MNVLITGIHGFLGKELFKRLRGFTTVAGLARENGVFNGFKVYSSKNLDEVNFNPEYIVHCHASVSSGTDQAATLNLFDSNVFLTERICKQFPDAKAIYISSVSIYDQGMGFITEISPNCPRTDYALSKLWGERIVRRQRQSAILRLSSMYGCGMKPNTIISNYVRQALSTGQIEVWGDGSRLQNYVHVSDVVGYIEALIRNFDKLDKKTFLGVNSNESSNFELAEIIAGMTGARINLVNEDASASFSYNNSYTTEKLGFKPIVSFKEGLEKYIECERKRF